MKIKCMLIVTLMLNTSSAQVGVPSSGDFLPEFLQQFDTNNDGTIDEEERQAIRDLRGKMREEATNSIDTDNDGEISAAEIDVARTVLRERIKTRRLKKFREIAGEDGLLSAQEFAAIPGMNRLSKFVFDAIFNRLDTNKSGDISSQEFLKRLRKHPNS